MPHPKLKRLRPKEHISWVVGHFPDKIKRLILPFARRGEVFIESCRRIPFEEALLNDPETEPFLSALQAYSGGAQFVVGGAEGVDSIEYPDKRTRLRRKKAGELLRGKRVQITGFSGGKFIRSIGPLGPDDLVYFDPPHHLKQPFKYSMVEHERFLSVVEELPCSVFISGLRATSYKRAFSGLGWCEYSSLQDVTQGEVPGPYPLEEVLWGRLHPDVVSLWT